MVLITVELITLTLRRLRAARGKHSQTHMLPRAGRGSGTERLFYSVGGLS